MRKYKFFYAKILKNKNICTFTDRDSIIKRNMDSGGQALSFSIKRKNSVRRTDMQDAFSRMELLVGNTGVKKLSRAKIAVFGLGGAGSQVAESLARCGVGSLTLIDHEKITLTNIGSQVLALHSTLGMSKAEAGQEENPGY